MSDRAELLERLRIDHEDRAAPRRPWFGVSAAAVIVAVLGGFGWYYLKPPAALAVDVALAEPAGEAVQLRGSLLDASGYIVARRQATVSSKITGKVVELLIEEGQAVEREQIVARLDDTNARAAVAQAAAQLGQAEASLSSAGVAFENAVALFERNEAQFSSQIISAQSFDTAKADYDGARMGLEVAARAVDVARANLAVAEQNLADTIVRAPFAGIVTVKAAQQGEMVSPVSAGGGFTRTGIGTIVDMESLEVEVDVSESFINRVHPGQDVTVRLNAYPDWKIRARVLAIIPTADRAKATVRVRVELLEKDARILPQMGVRVSFLTAEGEAAQADAGSRAVVVPPAAVEAQGETGIVYVIRDDVLERRAVRLGEATEAGQVVVSGLAPGVRLAVGDFAAFADGIRVRAAAM